MMKTKMISLSFSYLPSAATTALEFDSQGSQFNSRKMLCAGREVKQMRVRFVRSTGFLLLGIWLIITGIMQALSIGNPTINVLMGILAFFAGVFILVGR
jgi:hypothetical protein